MRYLFTVAAILLAGCQTPCPPSSGGPVNATYRCDDGSDLNVTFSGTPESVRVRQEGFVTVDLRARITGSGFRYAGGGAELRGYGPQVRWIRAGAAETICRRAPMHV